MNSTTPFPPSAPLPSDLLSHPLVRSSSRAQALDLRPAWIEIDLDQLRRNFALLRHDLPTGVSFLAVIKDQAYGHGALEVARAALEAGAAILAVYTLEEAVTLREAGCRAPLLLLGEREPAELPLCHELDLIVCTGEPALARACHLLARSAARPFPLHLEVDTGMSRYGAPWSNFGRFLEVIRDLDSLQIEGVMSHFAQSDETDKSFARLQIQRFQAALDELGRRRIHPRWRHLANSGGHLDLPDARFNLVRLGLLPLGVYPSAVCRRIPHLEPVLSVRTRVVVLRHLEPGESVGYGMRFTAIRPSRIAVLPLGYGDGYPRLRNTGHVLIRGQSAPIVGTVAMDTLFADVTDIPRAGVGDTVTLLGRDGSLAISARDLATWAHTVPYHILTAWNNRLPRRLVSGTSSPA